jgi:hypothetical protein
VSRDTAWEKLDKKQKLPVFVHLLSFIKITPYLKPEWAPYTKRWGQPSLVGRKNQLLESSLNCYLSK